MHALFYGLYIGLTGILAIFCRLKIPKLYYFTKPLPILGIMVFALINFHINNNFSCPTILLLIGLIFGLGGDLLLLNDDFFVKGLFSFLIGHIFYIIAMWPGKITLSPWFIVLVSGASLGYTLLLAKLMTSQKRQKFLLPVAVYVIVISMMLLSALNFHSTIQAFPWLAIGAALFYISDAVLSWDRFIYRKPLFHIAILGPYYAAQGCIFWGAINLANKL
jgi:uncharacterized membrane protein YhhN